MTALIKYRVCILALLLSLFISCSKHDQVADPNPPPPPVDEVTGAENKKFSAAITKQTTECWLAGTVLNEYMQPVAGATVACGGKTVVTDRGGRWLFKEKLVINRDYALIKVSAKGYLDGYRTFTANRNKTAFQNEDIALLYTRQSQQVAGSGGIVELDSVRLTFPASAIVDAAGQLYIGTVNVTARRVNPVSSRYGLTVPGQSSGLDNQGVMHAIRSFGIAEVELKDNAGNKLSIAKGKTVKLEIPAGANDASSLPLWHFNADYGLWIQAGTATKENEMYVAEVNHFSSWNMGEAYNNYALTLKFETAAHEPVSGLRVVAQAETFRIPHTFFPDNNGEATLLNCPSGPNLSLTLAYPCDTIRLTIPGSANDRTEIVTLDNTVFKSFIIDGSLSACNNTLLTNHPYQLFLNGNDGSAVVTGITDGQGHMRSVVTLPTCMSSSLTAQTVAYYDNNTYFNRPADLAPGLNTYDVTLCGTPGNGIYTDSTLVTIPDPELQKTVREIIAKPSGELHYSDVRNIKSIYYGVVSAPGIQSLIGLEYFTSLEILSIRPNDNILQNIADLTPIKELISLKYLYLEKTNISDLSQLDSLKNLTTLSVTGNTLTDLAPLSKFIQLKTLTVGGNMTDLSPLSTLTNLTALTVTGAMSDVSPISALTNLTWLSITGNDMYNPIITDISSLQSLHKLEKFFIRYTKVTDISVVVNFPKLVQLEANSSRLTDISTLSTLTGLKQLSLMGNNISDLRPISQLSNLFRLRLDLNEISDITPLAACLKISELGLSNNRGVDLAPLANHPAISTIYLDNNTVSSIEVLPTMPKLSVLLLSRTLSTIDLSIIAQIDGLIYLAIDNKGLNSIQPLINSNPNMQQLRVLEGNNISAAELAEYKAAHPNCSIN